MTEPHRPEGTRPARDPSGHRHDQTADRALERLADRSPSRVGVDGARRARDVSRPDAADLAAAEQDVVIRHARRLTR